MKKVILSLILLLFVSTQFAVPVQAGVLEARKARIEKQREAGTLYDEVKSVMDAQTEYTNKYDLEGLSKLYSNDFVNSDGFTKNVYFQLVQDTWETYPNISYDSKIKNITFNEKYARVEVYETAIATTSEIEKSVAARGELLSVANCIYYLEKIGSKWIISSEYIVDEKSVLRYGDARFVKMDLYAPAIVNSNAYYTATLKVDVPQNAVAIASIGSAKIIYPQTKTEDNFRKISSENTLERMFMSNKENTNEYAVASVGIAKSEIQDNSVVKVSMGGLAFIMTRVNVIPENKFIEDKKEISNGKNK